MVEWTTGMEYWNTPRMRNKASYLVSSGLSIRYPAMAMQGSGTAESPITLEDSPLRKNRSASASLDLPVGVGASDSPVKVLQGDKFR